MSDPRLAVLSSVTAFFLLLAPTTDLSTVSTLVGSQAGLDGPMSLAIAPDGLKLAVAGASTKACLRLRCAVLLLLRPSHRPEAGLLAASDAALWPAADTQAHIVRQIWIEDGATARLFGSGTAGSADGSAVNAQLNYPSGLTWTSEGALVVADKGSGNIRVIDWASTDGNIGISDVCSLSSS